jgi:hypothetical protein
LGRGFRREGWEKKGTWNSTDGNWSVKFGVLFDDEAGQQYYEALVGTLKAAKKRKIIDFKGQMLLKGAHDNVDVFLLEPLEAA